MRAKSALGDKVVVGDVAGTNKKAYPLAEVENNYTYVRISDQPEAQPGQPVSWPLTFHGGLSYSKYDPQTAGVLIDSGFITNEPNVIEAPRIITTVTLTGAANPPQYFFEADVNDSGDDDGRPRLYVIAPEGTTETNIYKISIAYGYTATGTGVTTVESPGSLTDARAAWTVNEWVGEIVYCNSQKMTITSNTATGLAGTGDWDGDPGDGNAYKIGVGDFGTLLATKTLAADPTQPQGRPAEWTDNTPNTYWRVPMGDSGLIDSLSSIKSSTTADTWSAGSDAAARHLRVVGNQLYRTTGNNKVEVLARATDPETDANWTGAHYVGDAATKITDIGEASGLCYIVTERGFHEWDGVGEADNLLPEIGNAPRNGQGMVFWHGGFLIPASSLWWTKTGKPVGPDSNPNNRGSQASAVSSNYLKHGRWMGLYPFGEYIYGLYVNSSGILATVLQGRERDSSDAPGWGPIVWHSIGTVTADFDDFHGIFITETSEFKSTSEVRPCLWMAYGNNVGYMFLDRDGAPTSRRGNIDLFSGGCDVWGGELDFGSPAITKQLRVIEGWGEDFAVAGHSLGFYVYRDGGSAEAVGAAITEDGFFQRFWVQDTADTARSLIPMCNWTGTSNLTGQDGPRLRDTVMRAVLKPNQTILHTFLIEATDNMKTSKKVLSEVEGYINTLKTWERPGGDTFNGFLQGVRLITLPKAQRDGRNPPRYALNATVRQMVGSA